MRLRIRRIASKLMLAYGLLFGIVLLISGVLLYASVSNIITERVDSDLSSTAGFIKNIVEARIDGKREEVPKDLIVAEYYLEQNLEILSDPPDTVIGTDYLTELARPLELPPMVLNGVPVLNNQELVDHIALRTGGEVSLYQRIPEGLLAVATTIHSGNGDRDVGRLVATGSPWDILVRRNGTFFGRDYFSGEWHFTAWKQIFDDSGRDIGAIFVAQRQVDLALLEQELADIKVGDQGFPFILDTLSTVIIHPDLKGMSWSQSPAFVDMAFRKNGRIEYNEKQADGTVRERIAFFRQIPDMNWILVVGSYRDDFYGGLDVLRAIIILIFGAAAVTSSVISLMLGRTISRPIVNVSAKLADIAQGEANLNTRLEVPSDDEVGRLAGYYNTFVAKLRDLQEMERRGVEVRLKDTQINALQAQINPHFLHNTLETVRYMIRLGDERAPEMVRLLAELFRISLGRGGNIVTFRQELEHVELYMSLQSLRYGGRFTLLLNVEPGVADLFTIRFILQPLVENCIHHGFEPTEGPGTVRISGGRDGERVRLTVEDNGVGMDETHLQEINSRLSEGAPGNHIGLKNVHDRIHLHFGESYGLGVKANPDGGTSVILELPALEWKPRSFHAWDETKYAFLEEQE